MELNQNLFDSMSMLVVVKLVIVTCLTIFYKLRIRGSIKVNCWFCNVYTKVSRQDVTWWLCPSCEQYNGFSKDGDYVYDIPEQYETSVKCTRYSSLPERSNTTGLSKSNLCADCNVRESQKLSELSNFEPKNEKFFNLELKTFREYLEKRYPLCSGCELMVRRVLREQALWLTHYKMLFFRQRPVKAVINKMRRSTTIFRITSMLLDLIIMYNHDLKWPPVVGLVFHLCTYWASSMKKNHDILLIFLWCCLITLVFIRNSILQNAWLTAEYIVQYHMVIICGSLIIFVSVIPYLYKNTQTSAMAFKKLKLHAQRADTSETAYNNWSKNNDVLNNNSNNIEPSFNTIPECFSTEMKSHSTISKRKLCTITTVNHNNNSYPNSVSPNNGSSADCYRLNDSLNVFSALSLSEGTPTYSVKVPPIFERKIYTATNCELFRKTAAASGKRYVLSPPKLRSVTQTSWVAGGYWQDGIMGAPTLSRSSSQSSGFGSAGSSNLAPSREPSVHEFDRCSVISDATLSCHTSRPSTASPMSTFYSPSPVPRAQSRYSVYDPIPTTATWNYSQAPLSSSVPYNTNAENHARELVASTAGSRNDSAPICSNHTMIVTSPGWLSALLCGSLILNMIVLCAMLLR